MNLGEKYFLKLEKESDKLFQKIIKIIFKEKINITDTGSSLKIDIPDKDNHELIKKRCACLLYEMPRIVALGFGVAKLTLPKSMVETAKKNLIKTLKHV